MRLRDEIGDGNILKTTDIRVSDEETRVEAHEDAGAFKGKW